VFGDVSKKRAKEKRREDHSTTLCQILTSAYYGLLQTRNTPHKMMTEEAPTKKLK
jgi:hypothetical protein